MSEQQDLVNSVVSGWLRCRFSFALLRTTLICREAHGENATLHVLIICRAVSESRIVFFVSVLFSIFLFFFSFPRAQIVFVSLSLSLSLCVCVCVCLCVSVLFSSFSLSLSLSLCVCV